MELLALILIGFVAWAIWQSHQDNPAPPTRLPEPPPPPPVAVDPEAEKRRRQEQARRVKVARRRAAQIIERAESLAAVTGSEYFAASILARFEHDRGAALNERLEPADCALLDAPTRTKLGEAQATLADRQAFRRAYNERFVKCRMADATAWFDGRATRLTDEQRRAVVTDEDTTLVIAAAGSGKTATIVAKAEYLVHRGLAQPAELCLLSYNKDAATEMSERLAQIGLSGATVSTFHALGYAIHGQARGTKPPVANWTQGAALAQFVQNHLVRMVADDRYRERLGRWFVDLRVTEPMLASAQTPHERRQREASLDLRSLSGVRLRSQAEAKLADWFTLNGVKWEYEKVHPNQENNPGRRAYQPDFYLPDYNLWVELWSLYRDGTGPPTFDLDKYKAGMKWKRAHHKRHKSTLVEVWQDDIWNGELDAQVRPRFEQHGVRVQPMSAEDWTKLLEAGELTPVTRLARLIATFLVRHRGSLLDRPALAKRATSARDQQFLELYLPILDAYEAELAQRQEIDFDAILTDCLPLLPQVQTHRFRYVLVDEFQDTSQVRMAVVQQLCAVSPGARAFVVGDDWQSINRFAGSDVALFTSIEQSRGPTARVTLGTTFRLLPDVAQVSAEFVMRNPAQIQKQVRTVQPALNELGVVLHGYEGPDWQDALARVFATIAVRKAHGTHVLVLARYNRLLEDPELKRAIANAQQKGLTIDATTIHRSKGLQADHVVVLGVTSAPPGFPSGIEDDPVLELVSAKPDPYPWAEERRLMYVALTRSKRRVYVLHSIDAPSPFIEEILEHHGDDVELIGQRAMWLKCPRCQGPTVLRRQGENGTFWGCRHYPECEGKLKACEQCDAGALQPQGKGAFQCSNHACGARAERCPKCQQGLLRRRTNRATGQAFWGCSEWRPDGGCTYTRSV